MSTHIIVADCLEAMGRLPEGFVDACVTDPPYHLQSIQKRFANTGRTETAERYATGPYGRHAAGFMGKKWDGGDIAMRPEVWAAVLRVLKPGGHLLAFGGTRTHHRVWCAIEDAGFEIRDTVHWMYGSGFPKSHDAGDGRGTSLKPACEPICLARKPLIGTVEKTLVAYGTGALNIDACRIHAEDAQGGTYTVTRLKPGATLNRTGGNWRPEAGGVEYHDEMKPGRWPANLIHDGSDEVIAHFPQAPGQIADASTSDETRKNQNTYAAMRREHRGASPRTDAGSAARFFYCAKATKADRGDGNDHPTVKPFDLMRYLCRLVTPPAGVVLDPFMGSGSTGRAALAEGFRFIGIEKETGYADIARRRIGGEVRMHHPAQRQESAA